MNKNKGIWTIGYTLLNIMYFAAFCTVHAYAAVFLLSKGFSNTEVGILLATANITSAVFQPFIAGVIDKGGWLTNRRFIIISCLIILSGSVLLRFVTGNKPMIFVVFAMIYMIQFAYQPVMTALCFEYQKKGCHIYYGLARGMGSAGFAVTSAFIGKAVEDHGAALLMTVTAIIMIISVIAVFFFKPADRNNNSPNAPDNANGSKKPANTSLKQFFHDYPAFMLLVIASICFFFAHNMINDFMIQIIRSLGGGETQLGYANFLQAILELPVMALIGFVLKKVSPAKLLVFSGVAFFVKILILVFAQNLVWMFISQSFQLFAYAVFIPAAAYYVSSTMADNDQVKGQAYVTSAITIGGVFSNLLSGFILDHLGMKSMLITGSVVCFVGVLTAFSALKRPDVNR
ncbi:MAG: MFS transporter [Lachnospiraceae bacterium]|nr:MFS transporter [Lachnospiraceae bacterium]